MFFLDSRIAAEGAPNEGIRQAITRRTPEGLESVADEGAGTCAGRCTNDAVVVHPEPLPVAYQQDANTCLVLVEQGNDAVFVSQELTVFCAFLRVFGSGVRLGMVTSCLPQRAGRTPLMHSRSSLSGSGCSPRCWSLWSQEGGRERVRRVEHGYEGE